MQQYETKVENPFQKPYTPKRLLKQFFQYAIPAFPMILFILVYFLGYLIIENRTPSNYHVIHVALDDMIPFIEIFVVPYFLWFFYMILGMIYLFVVDREAYRKASYMLYFGMSLFIVISLVFPNIQQLRPVQMPRDNIFTQWVQTVYEYDTPTNICPSIHAFNTAALMVSIHKSNFALNHDKRFAIPVQTLGVLIILATVFIKQHSVLDVIFAFILVAGCYVVLYRPELLPHRRRKRATNLI